MKRIALVLSVLFALSAVPVSAQEPDPVAAAQQQADQAEAAARAAQSRASQAQAEASAAQARANQAAAQAASAAREAEQARLNATLAEAQRLYEQALGEATAAVERASAALSEAGAALQAYEQARRNADDAIVSAQERATAAEGNLNTMSAVLDGEREQVAWLRIALVFVAAVGVAGLAFVGLLYTRQLKPVTIVEHHYDRAEQAEPGPARRALGVTIIGGSVAQEAIDHLDTMAG